MRHPLTLLAVPALLLATGGCAAFTDENPVAAKDGKIVYAGPDANAPDATRRVDCEGRWITPGLVDCHTHLVYAGDRAREFEMRLNGATYEEIAKAGGGIVSTVKATRTASQDELVASALPRLDALIADGACTVEIKSGYGLSLDDELKMLRAAFGDGVVEHYLHTGEWEQFEYDRRVTDWELKRGFERS